MQIKAKHTASSPGSDSTDPACAAALAEPDPPRAAADVPKEFIKVTRLQKPRVTAPPFPCHSPENKAPAELHMISFNYFLIFNVLVKLQHAEKKEKFMQSTLENSCSGKKLFCHEYAMAPGATGELVCIYRNCIYIEIRFQPAVGGGEGSPFFPLPRTDSALTGLDACIKTSADMHLFHKSMDKERGLLPAVFLPLFF